MRIFGRSLPELTARTCFSCLSVFLLTVFLAGCSSLGNYSNRYFPVNNHNKRDSSLGFSITPPAGSDWLEKLSDNSLYYLKQTQTQNYAIYTKATEIHLSHGSLEVGKFLQFVKNSKELNVDSGNYRNVSTSYSPDTELSPLCVRYYQKYEDHGDKNLKPHEFIKIRKNGLMCMHPDTLSDGVDMFYVESILQSDASSTPSYREEGESFLGSLQFFRR